MKSTADIFDQIEWDPTTVDHLNDVLKQLTEQGKYINDLETWLNAWQKYYSQHVSTILVKKVQNINKLKDRGESKLQYIIDKETKELIILNGLRIFFERIIQAAQYNKEHIDITIEKVQSQNMYLFQWAENYEKLYSQSAAGERILGEMNIKLLEENQALKQQLKISKQLPNEH